MDATSDSLACIETLAKLESLEIGGKADSTLNILEPANLYAMPKLKHLQLKSAPNLISIRYDTFILQSSLLSFVPILEQFII